MKFANIISTITAVAVVSSSLYAKEDEYINVNFNNMDLNQFVKTIGKLTGKNVLINGKLNGKVELIGDRKIKKSSLFTLANAILGSKGYALIDHGDFLEVVKASEAAGRGLEVSRDIDGQTMKTVLFPLKYSNAAVIRSKIKPLLHKNAKVISFKANNMLAVTAYPKTLQSIKKLIEAIENSGRRGTTIIRLKNAAVKDVYQNVVNMSKLLFPQTIPSEKVGVLKDEATNSLILVGKKSNVDKLLEYIKRLDRKGESVEQKMYVIPLKNSDVEEMEKILSKLVAQMNSMTPANAPKGAKNKKVTKAMVVGDKERNALIVLATPYQIKNIKEVIRKIDVAKPQVYVKAKIIEINVAKAKQVGLKYGFEGGKITTKGLFSLAGNLGAPSLMISKNILGFLSTQTTDENGNIITENPFSFPADIKELFALGIKVDLLQQHGAAHTLSEPSVLCSNNQEAEIYVGETRSILVSSATADTKDAVVRNKYSREDIGISLKVKPRISSNNKVALKVESVIEDIVPGSGSASDRPTTTKRKVTTNAIVNNGQTIILGGLMKSSGGKTISKVPVLGDIPILGALFTSTGYSESRINVVIYLTPYIVKNSRDLTKLREFLTELESIQTKFSSYIRRKLAQRAGVDQFAPASRKGVRRVYSNTRRVSNRPDPLEILRTRP
ncbi:MAG: type II secretion system secretin GspD [Epsilonproteobacteria bacterium]|nr:type II secretion system secretin GspD [Campylobacterota bacterium]